MVRLVKGAYWDTEIKRAQERGLADYPVFTRKAMTDLCYLDCARKLLGGAAAALSAIRHPQRAHRRERDRGCRRRRQAYEFQRLHGMGEALYDALLGELPRARPAASMRRSAAIADLLAYLVRRLLENGANSSFVVGRRRSRGADRRHSASGRRAGSRDAGARAPSAHPVAARPVRAGAQEFRRRRIRRPRGARSAARRDRAPRRRRRAAAPLIDGVAVARRARATCVSPIDGDSDRHGAGRRCRRSSRRRWPRRRRALPRGTRRRSTSARAALERAGDLIEQNRGAPDRAAAERGRQDARRLRLARCARPPTSAATTRRRRAASFAPQPLPGPTGESNELRYRGRGVVRLHQPVEFSARDLHRPGRGRARRRQCRRRQARRADAADRRRSGASCCTRPACRRARCIWCPATARSAPRSSPTRASPASPSPARPRSRAPSTARSPPRTGRSCR